MRDAIWIRDAALPSMAGNPRPNPLDVFSGGPDSMPDEVVVRQRYRAGISMDRCSWTLVVMAPSVAVARTASEIGFASG